MRCLSFFVNTITIQFLTFFIRSIKIFIKRNGIVKILKLNKMKPNAYTSIRKSMDEEKEISVLNNLDACACTGNGFCIAN